MEPLYYTNERSQQILISVLKSNGIRKVVASPGSTNVAFLGSLQNDSWFEIYSSVDERSAAYIACGLSSATNEPVILTCTGATASRNYIPALTEAFYRKIPIIAVTSNQGISKIGHLIPQNIDRTQSLKDICNISVHIGITKDSDDEWNNTILINKAILETRRHGGGPVHIDISTSYSVDFSVKELPYTRVINRYTLTDELPNITVGKIGVYIGSHKEFTSRETTLIDDFCATHDAIVIHDHTSGYHGKYAMNSSLLFGQTSNLKELREFDLLIHIGEVSGDYYGCIISPANVWRISEDGEIRDTFRKLSAVFEMPESLFFELYSDKNHNSNDQYNKCQEIIGKCYELMPELPFSNAWIAKTISNKLPQNSNVYLSILNTLRSWNWFTISENVKTFSNVGGFGIDGGLSTLVGASLSNPNNLFYAIIGDLSFFYDINVLGNRHIGNNLRILMINNGKGAEFRLFSHQCYQWGDRANDYMAASGHFGNKNPDLVRCFAENLGFNYIAVHSKDELLDKCNEFLSPSISNKPIIMEAFTTDEDESESLRIIVSILKDNEPLSFREKAKQAIKTYVPKKFINMLLHK